MDTYFHLQLLREVDKDVDAFFESMEQESKQRCSHHADQMSWQIGYLKGTVRALMQQLELEKNANEVR